MDHLLDEDIEMELFSAIVFEDKVLTQLEQPTEQNMDDTTTIPAFKLQQRGSYFLQQHCKPLNRGCSLPNEAGKSRLLSLLELKLPLPPLRSEAITPYPSNNKSLLIFVSAFLLAHLNPHIYMLLYKTNGDRFNMHPYHSSN